LCGAISILNAWNFFIDLARSLGGPGANFLNLDQELKNVVLRRFSWGCNLAPVTPPGKHYTPIWSSSEEASIQQLMRIGLLLWDTAIGNPSGTTTNPPHLIRSLRAVASGSPASNHPSIAT